MRLPSRILCLAAFAPLLLVAAAARAQTPAPAPAVEGKKDLLKQRTSVVSRAEEAPPSVSAETAPQPVAFESDIYCFGYVGKLSESFPATVTGAENVAEQTDFITDDLLYIDGGVEKGFKVGDEFWLVTPEQELFHTVTGKSIGRLYQYRGRVVVTNLEVRTATVRITHSCTDVPMGTRLKRFEPVPIPLARKSPLAVAGDPPSGKVKGRIVFTRDGVVALGQDSTVIVDLGIADGISPGDFLTVFRYSAGREYGIRPLGTYWVNLPPPPGVVVPRTYLGEAAVLMVGDRWAIARLTDSLRLIEVGDEVELK